MQRLQEAWDLSDGVQEPAVDAAALERVWANITEEIGDTSANSPAASETEIHTSVTARAAAGNSPDPERQNTPSKNVNAGALDLHAIAADAPPRSRETARLIPLRWMGLAATLLLGAVGLSYFLKPVTVIAPMGQTAEVRLHDGTRVELNSGASISYGRRFGSERRVRLHGEAFFDVVRSEQPFVVETFNASVQVLGTSFNVRAWEHEPAPNTRVSLLTGRVALSGVALSGKAAAGETMLPGQMGVVEGNTVSVSETDTVLVHRALAWRSGDFFFSNEWMGAILDDVARRFDVDVQVTPASLRNERLKFALENPASAEVVINEIAEGLGLRYRETSTGYEIFAPN